MTRSMLSILPSFLVGGCRRILRQLLMESLGVPLVLRIPRLIQLVQLGARAGLILGTKDALVCWLGGAGVMGRRVGGHVLC